MTERRSNDARTNIASQRDFVAARLDEIIREFEANAPDNPQHHEGAADGPLAVAQRHRARLDTADEAELVDIIAAHPEISEAWRHRESGRKADQP